MVDTDPNRIEEWIRLDSLFPISTMREREEVLGTKVIYDGRILRCHGDYDEDEYLSLIFGASNHAAVEGL